VQNALTGWANGDGELNRQGRGSFNANASGILLREGNLELSERRPPPFDHPLRRSDIHHHFRIHYTTSSNRKALRDKREPRLRRCHSHS
jgi:hypothetical protein